MSDAIFVIAKTHDKIRTVLEPLAITGHGNHEIMPLGTLSGHGAHLKALGHEIEV